MARNRGLADRAAAPDQSLFRRRRNVGGSSYDPEVSTKSVTPPPIVLTTGDDLMLAFPDAAS
jgi:hypothetical protein